MLTKNLKARVSITSIICLLILSISIALAADVSGRWKGSFLSNDKKRTLEEVFDLKVQGDVVSGTYTNGIGTKMTIEEGSVKGNNLHFTVLWKGDKDTKKCDVTGTINGDTVNLELKTSAWSRRLTIEREKNQK